MGDIRTWFGGRGIATQRRIHELDSLRGLAAAAVVLFHLTYWYDEYHTAPLHLAWGHYGVELFFIISGYVIFMTLERSTSIYDFAVSRAARLFPAYWCAIAVTSTVAWASFPRWDIAPPSIGLVLVNMTMLQRFFMLGEIDSSYWTLAIELSFYVAMACLFVSGRGVRIERTCAVWLVFAAIVRLVLTVIREHRNLGPFSSITGLYYGQFFILGMMIYRITRGEATPFTWLIVLGAWSLTLFGGGPYSLQASAGVYLGVTVFLSILVLLAASGRLKALRWGPLVLLGEMSYPLYLVHQRIGTELLRIFHDTKVPVQLQTALALTIIFALAYAIHHWVEVPGRAWMKSALLGASYADPLNRVNARVKQ